MQWDKVKTILLAILLAVDGFLAWNLSQNFVSHSQRTRETLADVRELIGEQGVQLAPGFSIPAGATLPALEAERSASAEEQAAAALLGQNAQREDGEDGSAYFTNTDGESIRFSRDGTLEARLRVEGVPEGRGERVQLAGQRLAGFPAHGGVFAADGEDAVRLEAWTAGVPLFDRAVTVTFEEGWLLASGRWTLELPYTTTGTSVYYDGADALLTYAFQAQAGTIIRDMTLGYRLGEENAGRIPLVVCWRIETDKGTEFLDPSKMAVLPVKNS